MAGWCGEADFEQLAAGGGVGAARPAPLVLGLALVFLLSIPWGYAVAHHLANAADPPTE